VKKNLRIKAISLIALSTLETKTGKIDIKISDKLIGIYGSEICFLNNTSKDGIVKSRMENARWEMIVGGFREGIANNDEIAMAEALIDTFDAVVDPSNKNEDIDTLRAFEFFNIPLIP
jgi:hypothetical protein